MKWVLLLYMVSGPGYSGGGPTTIEFPTKETCLVAQSTIKQSFGRNHLISLCIYKETGKTE